EYSGRRARAVNEMARPLLEPSASSQPTSRRQARKHVAVSSTIPRGRSRVALWRRRWAWFVGAPVALVVLVVVALVGHFLDEPMRRRMERTLNEKMTGYTVRLPRLDFHPLGFSMPVPGLKGNQNWPPNQIR